MPTHVASRTPVPAWKLGFMKPETGPRPKARLPSGKPNPEYWRWYYANHKDACRAASRKYNASEKAVAARQRYSGRYYEENTMVHNDETKCIECGMVFKIADGHARKFRFLHGNGGQRCWCDECKSEESLRGLGFI